MCFTLEDTTTRVYGMRGYIIDRSILHVSPALLSKFVCSDRTHAVIDVPWPMRRQPSSFRHSPQKQLGVVMDQKKTFKKTFTVHADGLSISSSTIFIDVCIFQLVSRNIFPNHTKSHTDSKCKKRSTNFMLMHCKSPSFFAIFESQNDHQSS